MAKNVLGGLYKKEDDKKRESLKEKEGKEMRKTESISGEINEAKIGGIIAVPMRRKNVFITGHIQSKYYFRKNA